MPIHRLPSLQHLLLDEEGHDTLGAAIVAHIDLALTLRRDLLGAERLLAGGARADLASVDAKSARLMVSIGFFLDCMMPFIEG